MKKYIIIGVVCFVIGFEVAWLIAGRKGGEKALPQYPSEAAEEEVYEATTTPTTGLVPAGSNAVAVNDQVPGSKVTVNMVTLASDGWVVIHEEKEGGPASILGARRLDAGTYATSTEVELLRDTIEGGTYYVMLHSDDGDKQFDHTKDLPIKDSLYNVIMMKFVATSKPTEQ